MAHINLLPGDQGVRLSTLSPKYLHTNSTSHTWPFSAVAELIDNAYDPDVEASQLWIDIERYGFEQCLSFTDNGAGMDSLKLHKMLSFGFCEKVAKKDHLPVGHYGNGFKSGSMRLGKDALVFTKNDNSRSVGFLSQTYLDVVNAQTILVPIVSWDDKENMIERADGDKAIQDILKHSLFKTKNELMEQFNKIKSQTGTRIVINSLRRTQEGKYEFDLRTDPTDIRIPDDIELESNRFKRQERQNHIPTSDYSLRAYCSILYLKPRMQIILRGRKVKTTVIAKSLSKTEVDTYKPQGVNKSIKVTFGFSQNKNHYGIMMYHRNRLIKPYVRVGYQMKANNFGVGVIGVIQCDYLQPTHNKQDFDYTKAYRSSMSALGSKLNDYWNEKKGKAQANSNVVIPEPKEVESVPDQLWVQCDNPECLKWRKLPPGVNSENLPEKWYCTDHPEEKWRSCDVPEELEDEKEQTVQPYVKKQKRRLEKELEEKRRKEKESKRMKELELEVKAQELKKKDSKIKELMRLVENKSLQQQQQKQQREGIKKETASPQKVQVKVVGPAMSRYQATTPTKKGPGQTTKVFLTPVSTPHQILAVKTSPSTTPTQRTTGSMTATGSFLQKSNTTQSSVQLVKVVGPGPGPSQLSNKQNQVVAFKLGTVTVPHTGIHPKVSGPPVVLKVNSKAAAEQVKFLPTMVPVTAVVDPKVVSVQSLASTGKQFTMPGQSNVLIKCVATPSNASSVAMSTNFTAMTTPQGVMVTPRNAIVTPGTSSTPGISMATPGISMVTAGTSMVSPGFSMATPGTTMTAPVVSMATPGTAMPTAVQVNTTNIQQQTPPKYLPLKSLIEVNRHATENTVSPITALIEDTSSSVPADKQNMKLISPQPMVRQDVTVNNRYRYIAPTGQPQGAQASAAAAASTQLIVLQQVKQEAPAVNSLASTTREVLGKLPNTTTTQQTVVKTEPTTASPNGPNFKRRHEQSDDGPVARKQKTDNDVIIIDPPSPPPIKPADQSESIFDDQKDTSLPNMDTSMPNMDTCMPNMDTSIPNMDTSIPNMDKTLTYKDNTLQNRDYTLPNKDLVEQKFVPIVKDGNMVNIDKDIIEEVNSMSPQQQLQALLNRTQQLKQLYSLRENVLKLLQVLVPELEVDEFRGKYKDQTIDELLQQVLEQAEKSDEDSCTIVT